MWCVKYDMGLPNAVLAFKLLDSCHLSQLDRQLALTAACELKFADNEKCTEVDIWWQN